MSNSRMATSEINTWILRELWNANHPMTTNALYKEIGQMNVSMSTLRAHLNYMYKERLVTRRVAYNLENHPYVYACTWTGRQMILESEAYKNGTLRQENRGC